MNDDRFVGGYGGDDYKDDAIIDNDYYTDEPALTSSGEEPTRKSKAPNRRETIEQYANSPIPKRQRPEERFHPPKQSATTRKRQTVPKRASAPKQSALPVKKKRNTVLTTFYITILCIGIAVCLTVLIVILQSFDGTNLIVRETPEPTRGPIVVDVPELRTFTGLITEIDYFSDPRSLHILDISTGRTDRYFVTETSVLTTRFGSSLSFVNLESGLIADLSYDVRNNEIEGLSENRRAQEFRNRTDVRFDFESGAVAIGNNNVFLINTNTVVTYRGEPFPLSQISPSDTLTISALDDTAWSIRIDAAHGFLQILNSSHITDGNIFVGFSIFRNLDDILESIQVMEGTHNVIVTGTNIEDFTTTVTISQGVTTQLDLREVTMRSSNLTIFVNPPDSSIYINGNINRDTMPLSLPFGETLIRVEREGYFPQEQMVELSLPVHSIEFVLVEVPRPKAVMQIETFPVGASIYIAGNFIGISNLTHEIEPGTYQVIARLEGYTDAIINVTVVEGQNPAFPMVLTRNDPWGNAPPPTALPPAQIDPTPSPTYVEPVVPTINPAIPTPTPPPTPPQTPPPPDDEDD